MKKGETVLISGINGFIGRNLGGILKEEGMQVAGLPRDLLMMPKELNQVLLELNPDYIFHCAAYGNQPHQSPEQVDGIYANIDETFSTNVIKTYNLLKAASFINHKAFINLSSSSVYGRKDVAMKETHLIDPFTAYACTKAAGEDITTMFAKVLGKPAVNVRPFSVYGPGEAFGRLIPNVVKSMVTGESLDLAPDPVHDWIFIEDFVDALKIIVENVDKLQGEVINVGTGRQLTNQAIVNRLGTIDPKAKFPINILEKGKGYDTTVWKANNKKLKDLGWTPRINIARGLRATYNFYKDVYSVTEGDESDPVAESLAEMGVEFEDPGKFFEEKGIDSDNIVIPE